METGHTDRPTLWWVKKAGLDPLKLDEHYPELKEFAFDSARKRMSSIRRYGPHELMRVQEAGFIRERW